MAQEDAKKFLDHVDKDPELQQKLKQVRASFVELGKQNGYNFTLEELHSHVRDRWGVTKPPKYDDPHTTCAM